jgi:hypothetical protein
VIVLSEYDGGPPIDEMGPTVGSVIAEEVGLNVSARHADYSQARSKAEAIWTKLHKLANTTLGSTRYLLVMAKGSPAPVGQDGNKRWMVGFNCAVTKERG